ncbi:MAG: hypothetical protein E7B94_00720, partial [Enterobacter sp.]|nr:hypothetical protein [Enterobacter sp.]
MKKVVTVCPYCASGCKIHLVVDNGKIVRAEAAQGKTNQGTLCLKGYYGWDFINDTLRFINYVGYIRLSTVSIEILP